MNNDRLLFLAGLAIAISLALVGRLYYIQVIEHKELLYQAQRQQVGVEPIPSERGVIYDRNMTVLSYSKPYTAFYVSVKLAKKFGTDDKIAKAFSKVTKKSAEYYKSLMASSDGRVLIERATSDTALQLKAVKFDGLVSEEEPQRIYPYNSVAAHVLGYTDKKTFHGIDGIEKEYDSLLQGVSGKRVILRDPLGNMIASVEDQTVQARPGYNVVLTIDKNIQEALEEELEKTMNESEGSYAMGIVMNPQTGEILAMANMRNFNPNNYGAAGDFERRNHAISDNYDPGSTFKAISISALLEKNLVQENEEVNTENGIYRVTKDFKITDAEPERMLTVEDVFAHSSNIGMAKLSVRIDKDELYKHIRAMGFGNETQIELPAEAHGLLLNPAMWQPARKMTIAYGYGISVTPIQLITAYSALINGGILNQPHVVKRVVTSTGEIVKENQTTPIRRVVSENTSNRMKKLFVRVIEHGTGDLARIPGMEVGGKTGTARMYEKAEYSKENYNASFIGFFPVGKPKYICLAVVNSPRNSIYGGKVSSPIFRRVAERIIKMDPEMQSLRHPQEQIAGQAPSQEKQSIQYPVQSNVPMAPVKTVESMQLNTKVMPDLRGLSIRDAIYAAERLKLRLRLNGHGKVKNQSITPGQRISAGEECTITGVGVAELAKF
jgi:cell division protein FtsI (penicillin-binding protein 3)